MVQQMLPVSVRTVIYEKEGVMIYFPQMIHYPNDNIQNMVNTKIKQTVFLLIETQRQEQGVNNFSEMIGRYEIKTNERGCLSINFSNYAIHAHFAHGLTIMAALNIDLHTGENVPLSGLFIKGSNYLQRLTGIVQEQIITRDIQLLGDVKDVTVSPTQDFYIADKVLVLYYQLYAITPYYVGLPMFPISVYQLEDMLKEDGLLGRMLA